MGDPAAILGTWANFYVMTGSSAAALTGLMFVVITLVRGEDGTVSRDGIGTFSTPTVIHFASALLIAAIGLAPWHELRIPAALVAIVALYGLGFVIFAITRARRMNTYQPDIEDWTWYLVMPLVAYLALVIGAIGTWTGAYAGLFTIAGGAAFLIFIGIRNAWDLVTYLVAGGIPHAAPDPISEQQPTDA